MTKAFLLEHTLFNNSFLTKSYSMHALADGIYFNQTNSELLNTTKMVNKLVPEEEKSAYEEGVLWLRSVKLLNGTHYYLLLI